MRNRAAHGAFSPQRLLAPRHFLKSRLRNSTSHFILHVAFGANYNECTFNEITQKILDTAYACEASKSQPLKKKPLLQHL